ncbi:lysophospholipase [Legionella antarctica]|uniref:Lysophospholipase n=2 Tax=Legionella antarctica TaxID=2708020 RepID=A0A6F8SZV6_9GAMM|nr:lysophospholipase [Legionella antarctica]
MVNFATLVKDRLMKKLICMVLGLLFSAFCFAADKRFDTMVIFGDSLSDTGNLYRYMWYKFPVSPPYFQGRFSNGILWVEQLYNSYYPQEYSEGFQNYAVGGAGAVLSYKQSLPFTLAIELNDYLYWNTYGKKESSLYMIWIGANNYLNGPTNIDDITDSVVDAIEVTIERLISYGGNKFFIPNIPDLGRLPQAADTHLQTLLTELTIVHNRKLAAKVDALKLKHTDATFVYFDLYSFFNGAIDHAQDYGFSNVVDPCYMGSYSGWLLHYRPDDQSLFGFLKEQDPRFDSAHWEMIKNNPELREAASASYLYQLAPFKNKAEPLNCDGYVFWDHVHPTDKVHYYIAQQAREALDAVGLEAFISNT